MHGTAPRTVVITHAYSSGNAGDGLLVEETISLARQALGDPHITVLAIDPESFTDDERIRYVNPFDGNRSRGSRAATLWAAVKQTPPPSVRDIIASADVVLAVGGGYLRGGTPLEYLKVLAAHRPQMPRTNTHTPFVYLPQSVGPHPPRWWPDFSRLRNASEVHCRDDRSLTELLERKVNAKRTPDLAALALAGVSLPAPVGRPMLALVARALPGAGDDYPKNLKRLIEDLRLELLVQSSGRGNDDPRFYRELGEHGPSSTLKAALEQPNHSVGCVISVRLHGSLQSLIAGVPSIHLSYERKGWGVYEDLGLSDYVHSARHFDREKVSAQAIALARDPSDFWDKVKQSLPRLVAARNALAERIQCFVKQ